MHLFRSHRAFAAASVLSAAAFVTPCTESSQSAVNAAVAMAPIKHVFVIVLENQGFDTTFAPTTRATYLADTLGSRARCFGSTTASGISVSTTTSR